MRPIEVRRDQAKNGWSPNRGPGEMLLLPGTKEQFRQKTTCKSKRGKGWGLTLHILVVRQSRYRLVGGNTRAQEIQELQTWPQVQRHIFAVMHRRPFLPKKSTTDLHTLPTRTTAEGSCPDGHPRKHYRRF